MTRFRRDRRTPPVAPENPHDLAPVTSNRRCLPPRAGTTANSPPARTGQDQDSTASQETRPVCRLRITLSAYGRRAGNHARQGTATQKARRSIGPGAAGVLQVIADVG